jgi:hypothetical protein
VEVRRGVVSTCPRESEPQPFGWGLFYFQMSMAMFTSHPTMITITKMMIIDRDTDARTFAHIGGSFAMALSVLVSDDHTIWCHDHV